MTTNTTPEGPTALPGDHQLNEKEHARLATGAVGLIGVLFMAVANAAPITAMSFNVPIAIGYGNGIAAPAGFLFATIVLTIFAVGYVAMSKHITTTGAFYGFISQGAGVVTGMVAGLLATVCYVIFEASLLGGFAYFAQQYVLAPLNININWLPIACVAAIVIAMLGYFKITLAASVLSVTLVCELVLLLALGISVLFKGGPDGYLVSQTLPPQQAFQDLQAGAFGSSVAAGAAAIGIFFAFWSWVGFETTAVYGEESKEPKKVVPRATMIAVIGLGLFYTFLSWAVVVGNGAKEVVTTAAGANPVDIWLNLTAANLGGVAENIWKILVVVGSFACALAFHNAAPRYIYAMGRESASPFVRRTIGSVNAKHGSPATAGILQTIITLAILILFFAFTNVQVPDANGNPVPTPDLVPYVNVYGLLAVIGTAMILIVQTLTCVAVIGYFWVQKKHKGNVITTLICPIVGGVGMMYALYLLWTNRAFAGGLGSDNLVYTAMPYEILAIVIIGLVYALWVKFKRPDIYAEIGQTVLEEAHERV